MTETVLLEYKQDIDELSLIPSSGGVFEVTVNGEKIYSKKKTGEFPAEDRIIDKIGQ